MTKKILFFFLSIVLFTGCTNNTFLDNAAAGEYNSFLSGSQKFAQQIKKTNADLSPEEEYYLGRAVVADIYTKYKPYNNSQAHTYINQIGNLLSLHSQLPETFKGYHFGILDSEEINAFATPGGFILITKGMIKLCDTEDALAAVLAHEIAHVQYQHGLATLRTNRWTSLLVGIGTKTLVGEQENELTQKLALALKNSVNDIVTTMAVKGYSRSSEIEADTGALKILNKAGYNQHAMLSMLSKMHTELGDNKAGFGSTHPSAQDRIDEISPLLYDNKDAISYVRTERFKRFIKKI